jgi:TBC1 domain family protein 5
VNLDVNRTYQDKDLFQNTRIKEMMVNILFIWAKENRDISYKQGMNEILAVILFGLYPFYFKNSPKVSQENILNYIKTDREKYAKEIYLYFHDEEDLASDLFFLFDAVMNKGIKDLYDNGQNKRKDVTTYKKYDLFQQQWTDEDDAQVNFK